jgi:hypothetical protein
MRAQVTQWCRFVCVHTYVVLFHVAEFNILRIVFSTVVLEHSGRCLGLEHERDRWLDSYTREKEVSFSLESQRGLGEREGERGREEGRETEGEREAERERLLMFQHATSCYQWTRSKFSTALVYASRTLQGTGIRQDV